MFLSHTMEYNRLLYDHSFGLAIWRGTLPSDSWFTGALSIVRSMKLFWCFSFLLLLSCALHMCRWWLVGRKSRNASHVIERDGGVSEAHSHLNTFAAERHAEGHWHRRSFCDGMSALPFAFVVVLHLAAGQVLREIPPIPRGEADDQEWICCSHWLGGSCSQWDLTPEMNLESQKRFIHFSGGYADLSCEFPWPQQSYTYLDH